MVARSFFIRSLQFLIMLTIVYISPHPALYILPERIPVLQTAVLSSTVHNSHLTLLLVHCFRHVSHRLRFSVIELECALNILQSFKNLDC